MRSPNWIKSQERFLNSTQQSKSWMKSSHTFMVRGRCLMVDSTMKALGNSNKHSGDYRFVKKLRKSDHPSNSLLKGVYRYETQNKYPPLDVCLVLVHGDHRDFDWL